MPRTLAIGDTHGCLNALTALAEFADFRPDDQLIALGDYVDRGPDSAGVIDWMIERYNAEQLIPLRGNHDVVFLDAVDGGEWEGRWESFGGEATIQSYLNRGIDLKADGIPERHRKFLEHDCRRIHEAETHFFVHASVHLELPLDEQPDWLIYWEKWFDPPPHASGKTMICGHTAQKSGLPLSNGHAVCIDTWVYGEGWLTCLDVDTGEFWQARENGETRISSLHEIPDSRSP